MSRKSPVDVGNEPAGLLVVSVVERENAGIDEDVRQQIRVLVREDPVTSGREDESSLRQTEQGGETVVSRVNFLETTADRIDDVARVVREVVHPGIADEPGYVGYIVLGDRESGNALGVTLWETDEARTSSDAKARTIRPRVEEGTGGTMRDVKKYDVLFFDIRSD